MQNHHYDDCTNSAVVTKEPNVRTKPATFLLTVQLYKLKWPANVKLT